MIQIFLLPNIQLHIKKKKKKDLLKKIRVAFEHLLRTNYSLEEAT